MDTPSKNKTSGVRRVYYVLSSHWDREWYQTYQDFRRRLVSLLDRVLDDLDGGRLRGPFTTDGQSIVLDDYLEIRPERRPQVERLVKSGRLKVGPWFVLPDEWLVSGESIVRNLRLGRQIARTYGAEPSDAGFVCDLFGHISQLPQIARLFGIKAALLWRGLEPRKGANLLWKGADGTALPCYRFGRGGYTDYAADVRHMGEPRVRFEPERALADLRAYLAKESGRTQSGPLLVFDGADHLEYDDQHYQLLFSQPTGPDFPYDVVHGTLDDYLDEMLAHGDQFEETVEGELREVGRLPVNEDLQWLIPGVLSSRVPLKQANAECQSLLCQWAEPFSALTHLMVDEPIPHGYLDSAWRWLLMNHPHDSICGCSIDAVHEDMKYRFAQCRQIAEGQTNESLRRLAASIPGGIEANELRVLVANPLSHELDEPCELTLQLPAGWGTYQEFFGYEPKPAFRIYDADGAELPYQLLAQSMGRAKVRVHPLKFPEGYKTNDVTVCVRVKLPALGYTTLNVKEGQRIETNSHGAVGYLPTRHALHPGLAVGECSMENEFLGVTIESNGTLTIHDRRNGAVYRRLLTFEDVADIGDGWYHGPAVNDQRFVSSAASADVALVQDGPLLCRFRVRVRWSLPEEFELAARRRSERFVPLAVDSLITLRAGCDRLEVETLIDNQVKDHRVRVLFPTGIEKVDTYLSDGAFDVVERKIGLPSDNHLGRELAVEACPQQTWTAVAADGQGLAVVARGLFESAVRDLRERQIALTLFRSTRRTVLTDGEPQGQLQGPLKFNYWIVPIAGAVNRKALCEAGLQLAGEVRCVQLVAEDLPLFGREKTTPVAVSTSLLKLEGDAVLSSVRPLGGAVEVRLFNPETHEITATLQLGESLGRLHKIERVDFESRPLGELALSGPRELKVILAMKEIVTLRFSRSE